MESKSLIPDNIIYREYKNPLQQSLDLLQGIFVFCVTLFTIQRKRQLLPQR